MLTNEHRLIEHASRYFAGSYEQFEAFGGPCVYFHRAALAAAEVEFLSDRHIELIYATLTAWGMHRMGDVDKTVTKLTNWQEFRDSFSAQAQHLDSFRDASFLSSSPAEYAATLSRLKPIYIRLSLSRSDASIVANSKALHHVLPSLIPPIDRQYTVRFFHRSTSEWLTEGGKYKQIQLPKGIDAQFDLFVRLCVRMHAMASRIDPSLFFSQLRRNGVPAPKALDNAIVQFVRTHRAEYRGG